MAQRAGTRTDPSDVLGPNEYAGNVAPKRADASTVTYYGDKGGNTVDRSRINKTMDRVSTQGSPAKPGGQISSSGY